MSNITVWAIDPGSSSGHIAFTARSSEDLKHTTEAVTVITGRDQNGIPIKRVVIPWSSVIRIEESFESGETLIESM